MPKQPINYENTIIYKLVCKNLNVKDLYVGHTTNFTKRKYQHHHNCTNPQNKHYNLFVYDFIRNNGGWDNWDMIEVEKFSCKDIYEATKRERYWYEDLKATLNVNTPIITAEERKDYCKTYMIKYREEHKEEIEQKQKEYNKTHKEEIKHYNKEYRKNNREQLNEQKKIKVPCEFCFKLISNRNLPRHKKEICLKRKQ